MSDRKAIYYRFNSGESLRSIGRLIGRHHTTISRRK
ncbi:helix-turn-helix domain-containing protein [Shewanella gelidimarina]|nr:helix-turn-helix domain-containing protein [Shewanella gelidimarina]